MVTALVTLMLVTLCRAQLHQLALRPAVVTIRWYTVLLCNQPLRPTQSPILGGMVSDYPPGAMAELFGREGNRHRQTWHELPLMVWHRTGHVSQTLWYIHLLGQQPKEG